MTFMHIKIQAGCWGFICLDFPETDMNHTSLLISDSAVGKKSYSKTREGQVGRGIVLLFN